MRYKQDTYTNGKLWHTRTISADYMVDLLSRVLVFKECGHKYTFEVKRNANFDVVKYTVDFDVAGDDPRHVHQEFFPIAE